MPPAHGSARRDGVRILTLLVVLVVTLTSLLGAERARAQNAPRAIPEILPIEDVRRGMKGVGRTVFQGAQIEEFGVEILSVMRRTRPQGDLILFRGEGTLLEHTGIIAGMSGSPVYIDGKLVGAVAFAYSGAKDPIGAITPIGEMLAILEHGVEPADRGISRSVRQGDWESASTSGASPLEAEFHRALDRWLSRGSERAHGDGPAGVARDRSLELLRPVDLPLSLSGWAPELQREMEAALAAQGLSAVATPSGGTADMDPAPLVPGSAVGIQFVRGDADLTAIGTVTWTDGDRVLAFGHPMIQAGAVSYPMTTAWIHEVIATLAVSVKMGAGGQQLGGIYQDRRAGIAGQVGAVPDLLPVRLGFVDPAGETSAFRYELARHPFLTPMFIPWTVTNSFLAAGWSMGDVSLQTETTVHYDGGKSVTRRERISTETPGPGMGQDIALPATLLFTNPFEAVRLDSIVVTASYLSGNSRARVVQLSCDHSRAEVGDTLRLAVEIEPYRGTPEVRRLEVVIPPAWAGKSLRILCGGTEDFTEWDRDRAPEKFEPRSLPELVDLITEVPDESALTLRVYSAEAGALVRGVEISGLPPSLAAAAVGSAARGSVTTSVNGRLLDERRYESPYVLTGGEQIEVEVAE